jgi:hypothetical protein
VLEGLPVSLGGRAPGQIGVYIFHRCFQPVEAVVQSLEL